MKPTEADGEHEPEEAQRRFEKLVRTALATPPKPMKDMPRKRPAAKTAKTKPRKAVRRSPSAAS